MRLINALNKTVLLFCFFNFYSNMVYANTLPHWNAVPTESQITFSIIQNGAPVTGSFKEFSADINASPNDLANSHVKIDVDMNSVKTSYDLIAETLKSADWFNIKLFPTAVFESTHFTKTGDNTYQVTGKLRIKDKTLPVVLNFELKQYSESKALIEGYTTLQRTQFDLAKGDWAKTDALKDDVRVRFILSAKNNQAKD